MKVGRRESERARARARERERERERESQRKREREPERELARGRRLILSLNTRPLPTRGRNRPQLIAPVKKLRDQADDLGSPKRGLSERSKTNPDFNFRPQQTYSEEAAATSTTGVMQSSGGGNVLTSCIGPLMNTGISQPALMKPWYHKSRNCIVVASDPSYCTRQKHG